MGFVHTIDAVVAGLKAGGQAAASDPADLNPPAVLVTPGSLIAPGKLCGTPTMRLFLDLVARDSGDRPALEQLQEMYDLTEPLVRRYMVTDPAPFTRMQTAADPTGLPALRFTIETPVTD